MFKKDDLRRLHDDAIDFVRNSYVTSAQQSNDSINERLIACAVLGIVPSC